MRHTSNAREPSIWRARTQAIEENLARYNSTDSFIRKYELTRDGYLMIPNGEGVLLVDTGAPISFGRGFIGVPGVPPHPPESLAEGLTIEWLVEHIHHPFDGLVGAEVLRERTLVIDPTNGTLDLTQTIISSDGGVPIRHLQNVPIFDGKIASQVSPVIFDTGAPLGFVPVNMVRGLTPIDRISEFYPMFGPFETDVYELPLEIGDEQQVLRFGTFPEKIEQMHAQAGMPVLIGLGLLKHYRISVGLREQRLMLEPIEST
jgi:hypothetical protein